MQQSGIRPKSRPGNDISQKNININKAKIKKIMKFDKVIQKFCDQIGIEKKTLLSALQGEEKVDKGVSVSGNFDLTNINQGRPVTSQPDAHNKSIDTGKAALLAYTNLDPPNVEDLVGTDWRKGQNTRNVAIATTSGAGEPQNIREH